MTFLAFSRIFTVRFPVPGPTSSTIYILYQPEFIRRGRDVATSLCFKSALSTIACATPGFLRTCCPNSVFILKILFATLAFMGGVAYGLLEAAPLRFLWSAFGILILTACLLFKSFLCHNDLVVYEMEDVRGGHKNCGSELKTTLVKSSSRGDPVDLPQLK